MAVAFEILRETIALGKTGAGKALTEEVGLLLSSSAKNLPSELTKLGDSTVGSFRAPAQVKQLEELYRNAPIRFADRPGDLFDSSIRTGTIQGLSLIHISWGRFICCGRSLHSSFCTWSSPASSFIDCSSDSGGTCFRVE